MGTICLALAAASTAHVFQQGNQLLYRLTDPATGRTVLLQLGSGPEFEEIHWTLVPLHSVVPVGAALHIGEQAPGVLASPEYSHDPQFAG